MLNFIPIPFNNVYCIHNAFLTHLSRLYYPVIMNGTSPFPILGVLVSYSFFSNFDRTSVVKREESGQRTRCEVSDLGLHCVLVSQ